MVKEKKSPSQTVSKSLFKAGNQKFVKIFQHQHTSEVVSNVFSLLIVLVLNFPILLRKKIGLAPPLTWHAQKLREVLGNKSPPRRH